VIRTAPGPAIPTTPAGAARDPHFDFWLEYCERSGALVEAEPARATVVLTPELLDQLHAPEVITVTSDPEVAREEGATLMIAGHPYIDQAVETVLAHPDAGNAFMPWPSASRPGASELVQRARDSIAIEHGRVDRRGEPASLYLPLLYAGVLVTYAIDRPVQEIEEACVHGVTATPLGESERRRLLGGPALASPDGGRPKASAAVDKCLGAIQTQLAERARARALALEAISAPARDEEFDRTRAFYEAALESLRRREAGAPPERSRLYAARAVATKEELARRLQEVEDKFRPRVEMRLFRLHLLWVPAYQLSVDVRRGDRFYPLELFWLPDLRGFAPIVCPHCGAQAGLVAGKQRMGCLRCLHPPAVAAPAMPAPPTPARTRGGDGPTGTRPSVPLPAELPPGPPDPGGDRADGRAAKAARESLERAGQMTLLPAPDDIQHGGAPERRRRVTPVGPGQVAVTKTRVLRSRQPEGTPLPDFERELREYRQEEARLEHIGSRLAPDFWGSAFVGRKWPRVSTDSPLSLLYALYGPRAPFVAIGSSPDVLSGDVFFTTIGPGMDHTAAIIGYLDDVETEIEVEFTLRWRASGGKAIISEVLPGRNHLGPHLPRLEDLSPHLAENISVGAPPPRVSLGHVARVVWEVEVAAQGMPMAVRCVAAWQRLRIPVPTAGEAATAAAIAWVVGRTARLPRKRDETATAYGIEPGELARAAQFLKPHLRVSDARPW
jgi:hypothetical protein